MNPMLFPDTLPADAGNALLAYDDEVAAKRMGNRLLDFADTSVSQLRRATGAVSPANLVSARDVAGFLPGAGMVEGYEQIRSSGDRLRSGDYIGAASDFALGAFNAGTDMVPVLAPLPAIFAGPAARTADRGALEAAERMAADGADRRAVWDATGWFKGADGQWRFEIDDSPSRLSENAELFEMDFSVDAPFRDVLEHPALADAYDIGNRTRLYRESNPSGTYSTTDGTITARVPDAGEARSVLLHEAMHDIQKREGFGGGASVGSVTRSEKGFTPDADVLAQAHQMRQIGREWPGGVDGFLRSFPDRFPDGTPYETAAIGLAKNPDELSRMQVIYNRNTDPVLGYHHVSGEVEARNVQARRDMTPDQRRASPPWETQDVPDDMQIVRTR